MEKLFILIDEGEGVGGDKRRGINRGVCKRHGGGAGVKRK